MVVGGQEWRPPNNRASLLSSAIIEEELITTSPSQNRHLQSVAHVIPVPVYGALEQSDPHRPSQERKRAGSTRSDLRQGPRRRPDQLGSVAEEQEHVNRQPRQLLLLTKFLWLESWKA